MRTPMTISLPDALAKDVRRDVKKGNFASASEYFRHVLREYKKMNLSNSLHKQKKDFDSGKGHVLKSLRDLR
jgi:Arc/MetJ-type ribon-helix-helix transcriptional regulator